MSKTLWKDKKRNVLLPAFESYTLGSDRLIIENGLLRKSRDVLMLYRVLDIKLERSFFQRMFGWGTIILITNDASCGTIELKGIENSEEVMDKIIDLVEKSRKENGVRISEFSGGSSDYVEPATNKKSFFN